MTVAALAGKTPAMGLADAWVKVAELDPASAYAAMATLIADPGEVDPAPTKAAPAGTAPRATRTWIG